MMLQQVRVRVHNAKISFPAAAAAAGGSRPRVVIVDVVTFAHSLVIVRSDTTIR